MMEVLPVIIICGVGIAGSLAYLVYLCVKAVQNRTRKRPRNEFEIEDDTIVIRLGRRRKNK